VQIFDFENWSKLNEASSFDPDARYPDQTFGLPAGQVDTSSVVLGGEGGNWGGSMPRALWFASIANEWAQAKGKKNVISSQKRSREKTASGNMSDHFFKNSDAYAVDLSVSGTEGDELLAYLMARFGHPEYKGGSWFNVKKNGYRYQIGWKVKDHFDHIHVGVKKAFDTKVKDAFSKDTFGQKLYKNPLVQAWFRENSPQLSTLITPEQLDSIVTSDPTHKQWFMDKFYLDQNGDPLGSPKTQNQPVSTGSVDISKGNFDEEQKKNISALIGAMNQQGITNPNSQIGILSVISKESAFKPKDESNYSETPNSRIRDIFGKRVASLSDTELTALKKDPRKFFNLVYAKTAGNNGGEDGWTYRGRGFNQLTGKANYEKYSKLIGLGDELVKNPEKLNDSDIAAKVAIAFLTNKKSVSELNNHSDKKEAAKYFADINAGTSSPFHREKSIEASDKFEVNNSGGIA
jgi:predicted chitinase